MRTGEDEYVITYIGDLGFWQVQNLVLGARNLDRWGLGGSPMGVCADHERALPQSGTLITVQSQAKSVKLAGRMESLSQRLFEFR